MQAAKKGYSHANGIELYYAIQGSGQPLVLIHGGGSSFDFDFAEISPKLSGTFQLIGMDLQNHGRSGHRDIPETFEQDARDIAAVLDALGIGKASLMGFSNGATTVLQFASLFPARTHKVIAASGLTKRAGMIDGFFEGMAQASLEQMPAYLKDHFLQLCPDEAKLRNMFEKDSRRMQTFRDWDDAILASIQAPVFFIAGDRDVIKTEHQAAMSRLVPRGRLMILPAGHGSYMMTDEQGHADQEMISFTAEQIRRFLQD